MSNFRKHEQYDLKQLFYDFVSTKIQTQTTKIIWGHRQYKFFKISSGLVTCKFRQQNSQFEDFELEQKIHVSLFSNNVV